MRRSLFLFLLFTGLLTAAPVFGASVPMGPCRYLTGDERARCISTRNIPDLLRVYGSALHAASSSSSSEESVPVSFPNRTALSLEADPSSIPDGISCVRLKGARQAECRIKYLKEFAAAKAGQLSSAASTSSSASNDRFQCIRLKGSVRRRCLINSRAGISATTKTVK